MSMFALTNGFVSTMCAIKAPTFVSKDKRDQVGMLVGIFLGSGILLGAISAIPVGAFLPTGYF